MMKQFFAFFISRPMIVNLIMMLVLVAGFNTIRTANIQGAVAVEFGVFTVSTIRAGSSPEKMELSVTVPLEEELLKVDNVKRVISNSMEGLSIIQINADTKATARQLAQLEADLQKAIDRSAVRLPQDLLEKPLLNSTKGSDREIVGLLIAGGASENILRKIATNLQGEIRELKDVSAVEKEGYRNREVRVMLDPEALSRLSVSFDEVRSAISSRNVTETGGSLESFVGEQDSVAIGEFKNPKDVANVIVRASEKGDYLKLRDVAEIVLDYEDWQTRFFYQGQPAIYLRVKGESVINEFVLMDGVQALVDEARTTLPDNVSINIVEDGSDITRKIMFSLLNNAAIGGVLIAIALLFFFPWRAMVWVVAGLPIAILFGLVAIQGLGLPISATAMVAMIMMLGLLVDDAIVSSESIYRHYELGMSPSEAGAAGMAAISRPVFTGAITTVIAMSPLLLIGGTESKFMWMIPATVVLMVLGSLFECMILMPSHIVESLKRGPPRVQKAQWFSHIEQSYRNFLNYYLSKPWRSMLTLALIVMVSLGVVARFLNFQNYPPVDTDKIIILLELPSGSSLESTTERLKKVEQLVYGSDKAEFIRDSYIVAGSHDLGKLDYLIEGQQKSWGKVSIRLTPFNQRSISAQTIALSFEQALAEIQGIDRLQIKPITDNPPAGFPVELQIIMDGDEREIIAAEVIDFLSQHPGVSQAWSSYSPGRSLIELNLNHEAMADFNIKVSDVTRALQVAFDGVIVEELQTREELIRYRLQLQDRYRRDVNALRSLSIISPSGEAIPLRNIAQFEVKQGRFSIPHFSGRRTETVFSELNRELASATSINADLKAFVDGKAYWEKYPDVRFRYGGELETQQETAESMGSGMLLVASSIFFVMVLLFNSLSLPIATLMIVPLAFIGVLLVFVLHDLTLSVAATVGLLGLIGVLVNGALVMIDHIRVLSEKHAQTLTFIPTSLIIDGAVMRLRPLLITALTTIVGLGPAAYGIAGTHPVTGGLLMVMFWGVAVGTLITLFTLPLFLVADSAIKRRISLWRGAIKKPIN
jgi:multidrug efflux pump subunit AcrB